MEAVDVEATKSESVEVTESCRRRGCRKEAVEMKPVRRGDDLRVEAVDVEAAKGETVEVAECCRRRGCRRRGCKR